MQQNCILTIWREKNTTIMEFTLLALEMDYCPSYVPHHVSQVRLFKNQIPIVLGGRLQCHKVLLDQVHFKLWGGLDCHLLSKVMHLLLF